MKNSIQQDIDYLKMLNFFPKSFQISDIDKQLHLKKRWADAFWRRRKQHEKRIDPEITYLNQIKIHRIGKALEIGAGYGRVSAKLIDLEQIGLVTAIEKNPHFSKFAQNYIGDEEGIVFMFEDFLTTRNLQSNEFDLIVLPMNTFPTFPHKYLMQLFDKVRMVLKPGGKFLFTTYPETESASNEETYEGELLVELGEDPLAIEFFTMKEKFETWGSKKITYSKYQYLTRGNLVPEIKYFLTERNFYHHDYLVELIRENHMDIVSREQIEHSTVFVCEIRDERIL